ncbi:MAG: amino acid ABC transporter permease [Lachnospiraceae bacterium]|nr:amino acid ABC transporter permease [Lachnospiraceae bacterium]
MTAVPLAIPGWLQSLADQFYLNFIKDDRYMYLVRGLKITLEVTVLALILGVVLGVIIAIIRSTHDKTIEETKPGFGRFILKFLNAIAKIYLTVIRGTPVVVQLMIIYFVIFASSNNKVMVASIAFGINSGAYVAEIIRSGIMSIDQGQFEAGRSLGFNYFQTMIYIIIPQAFKNVLPALGNEFIVLIKETSVSGYVGLQELTKAGDIIRSRTYTAFMPLIAVALIYLVIVMIFSKLVSILERRLRNSER